MLVYKKQFKSLHFYYFVAKVKLILVLQCIKRDCSIAKCFMQNFFY